MTRAKNNTVKKPKGNISDSKDIEVEVNTTRNRQRSPELTNSINNNNDADINDGNALLNFLMSDLGALLDQVSELLSDLDTCVYSDEPELNKLAQSEAVLSLAQDIKNRFYGTSEEVRSVLRTNGLERPDALNKITINFNTVYTTLMGKTKLINKTVTQLAQPVAPTVHYKLPDLKLPTFNGEQRGWENFYNSFKSLILDDNSVDLLTKFKYLQSCLTGPPADLINTFTPSADNFVLAWKALFDRYGNPRMQAKMLLNKILNFKSIKTDSISDLTHWADIFTALVASLKNVSIPSLLEFIFYELAAKVLPADLVKNFELSERLEYPCLDDIKRYVNAYIQSSRVCGVQTNKPTHKSFNINLNNNKTDLTSKNKSNCPCERRHPLAFCKKFISMKPFNRFEFVRNNKYCIRCLRAGHLRNECNYMSVCRFCASQHHTLLHFDTTDKQVNEPTQATTSVPSSTSNEPPFVGMARCKQSSRVLLPTILLVVTRRTGERLLVRALADNCSQISVIDRYLADQLGYTTYNSNVTASSFSGTQLPLSGRKIDVTIESRIKENVKIRYSALIVNEVSNLQPSFKINETVLNEIREYEPLADPELATPSPIHLLIGADILPLILNSGSIECLHSAKVTALNSDFGWLFFGPCGSQSSENSSVCALTFSEVNEENSLIELVHNFWKLEEPPKAPAKMTKDEILAEELFVNNVKRLPSGRFSVGLPFKPNPPLVDNNLFLAKRRFLALEKKFRKDGNLKEQYVDFMETYQSLGHMAPTSLQAKYVIPHHPVFKMSPDGPKIRVVFDASAPSSTGFSLNDTLLSGPKLQADIVELLCKFRLPSVVFATDVVKMFRQILVHDEHHPFQTVFWRSSEEQPLKLYTLKTVTYGMKSSPFLAIRVLHHLAHLESERFPLASKILLNNTYVDDIMAGSENPAEAICLAEELISLLETAGLSLSKWISNSEEFRRRFSNDSVPSQMQFDNESIHSCKILGLNWDPIKDVFNYKVDFNVDDIKSTKRSVLSFLARIYDPIGGLSPIILWLKFFVQKLWRCHLDWDEELPTVLNNEWINFMKGLPDLTSYSINRRILHTRDCCCQLIGFADASERGYAAVVYLRSVHSEGIKVSFLASKTRVAPLKALSIPRLELCAALLLVQLMAFYKDRLSSQVTLNGLWAFSDSTTVLAWLRSDDLSFKTFVSNRVAEIHRLDPQINWYYIPTSLNPADSASRGLTPFNFIHDKLFQLGPSFLAEPLNQWHLPDLYLSLTDLPESKSLKTFLIQKYDSRLLNFIMSCSSWLKIQRVCAYIIRIVKNFMTSKFNSKFSPNIGATPLTLNELKNGAHLAIRLVQRQEFTDITSNSYKGSLLSLRPFKDNHGIVRVGGRLTNANIPYEQKHPILLPKKCHLTNVIIDHFHKYYLHAGLRLCQSLIMRQFWIVSSKVTISLRLKKCTRCTRFTQKPIEPLMGALPSCRVNPACTFINTGVDFAGPFPLKTGPRRNSPITKAYMAIFICMVTKAVHLELVSNLTTEKFLEALDRFVARRGLPKNMFSDCGKNFVGANRYLTELHNLITSSSNSNFIISEFAKRGITWNFSPPSAPHFGGLWEAGVKSVKFHLKRIVGHSALFFEEWVTLLAKIEAVLNSRPLVALGSSPDEVDCLTPGHFLIGRPLAEIPDCSDLPELQIGRLKRWHMLSSFLNCLWARFVREYLYTLQSRNKWKLKSDSIKKGQVVLIQDFKTPPSMWPLAVITDLHLGSDGVVRVVSLRTANTSLKRPVVKIVPLPVEPETS